MTYFVYTVSLPFQCEIQRLGLATRPYIKETVGRYDKSLQT